MAFKQYNDNQSNNNTSWNNEVAQNFYKLLWFQTLNTSHIPLLKLFQEQELVVGKGLENVQFGLLKPEDFNESGERVKMQPNFVDNQIEKADKRVDIRFTLSTKRSELLAINFAKPEELEQYQTNYLNQLQKSFELNKYAFVYHIFGKGSGSYSNLLTTKQLEVANSLHEAMIYNKKIINNPTRNRRNAVDLSNDILSNIYDAYVGLTQQWTEVYTLDKTTKTMTAPEDIVIIAPTALKKDLKIAYQNTYLPKLYEFFETLDVLYLPYNNKFIYIFNKNCLQFATRLNSITSEEFANVLQFDNYLTFFGICGVFKRLGGCLISYAET